MFSKRADLEVRSAGTASDALARVNAQMLDWADLIFIMDEQQRRPLHRRFAEHPADEFTFLQPELMTLLESRVTPHLPGLPGMAPA